MRGLQYRSNTLEKNPGGEMPYSELKELPKSVRSVLPEHAQEIYLAAFNNAWEEYSDSEDRQGESSREETAHKVAWSAVKQKYEKVDDEWQSKNSDD
jgi:cation transport regulator